MAVALTMTAEELPGSTEELLLRASVTTASDAAIARWEELAQKVEDWQMFVRKADGAHLSPLLSQSLGRLREGAVPASVLERLRRAHRSVLMHNIRLYAHFEELVNGWSSKGIRVIPLKGIHLAEKVYGDIGLRHLSDIDLLVRPADLEAIMETATALGWQAKEMHHQSTYFKAELGSYHPFKLIKDATVVELHVHVHRSGGVFAVCIDDYWHRATPGRLSGCAILELDATDMLQHLCLHLYKHLQAMELKKSGFCDIRELVLQQERPDWELLMQRSTQYGMAAEVGAVLFLCREFWGCEVPDAVLKHVPAPERERCTAQFLKLFTQGTPEQDDRWQLALGQRLSAWKAAPGLKGKLRFIRGYVLPDRPYLEQRYGSRFALPVLRAIHVWSLAGKTLRVATKRFNGRKAPDR